MKEILDYTIRPAHATDIPQIARVHIQSWKETYPGIMPQEKLASLNLERSILNWQNCLERGEPFFVAVMDGRVLGFVSGGKNRSNESCETGKGDACDCELAAMYLLKDFQGLGIGKALFQSFREEMRKQSYQSMVAWVAEKNPSTAFYARMGGELADRKNLVICAQEVPVVAYTYTL